MDFSETTIKGLFFIQTKILTDPRGSFVKTFQKNSFETYHLKCEFKESFFTISGKNVIRGMHFQTPPHEHGKLVYVSHGRVLDVVLDIRAYSPTYGCSVSKVLSGGNGGMLYIPKGCAHGFLSMDDNTIMNYLQTSSYSPEHDKGISYSSFGFDWKVTNALISARDESFPKFKDFNTPFTFKDV